jgi:succinate dehydrogenase hydrophobic anchor subunit
MHGVARNFFTLALLYAICGMALGLHMSISQDHSQMPTHAHALVAGWLMSAVFAFYYHLVPAAARMRLATFHFWLMTVSGIALIVGLYFLLGGHEAIEPMVAIGSMAFYAGMILFAGIALKTLWAPAEKMLSPIDTTTGQSIKNVAAR